MEISVVFLIAGCLIKGVLCGYVVTLPEKGLVEGLQGSCVFIPCAFDIDEALKDLLKDSAKRKWCEEKSEAVVFDTSSPNKVLFKGEMFGTATQKNCTTRVDNVSQNHNGKYYFRLEAEGKLLYSYKTRTVEVIVTESPPKPTVSVFEDQQEVTELTEGRSVTLRCSTKIYCPFRPPYLTWSSTPAHFLNQIITQQHENQTHLISEINFNVTHRHHRATFTCTVTHQLQQNVSTNGSRQLSVQYGPKSTSVSVLSPTGFVVEGDSVTLSCSSDSNPVVSYTWIREGDPKPVQTGPNLTINNINLTHNGQYYCTAKNKYGTQNTSVLLDVKFPPKDTSVSVSPAGLVVEGDSVTLSCSSDSDSTVNYTWIRERDLKPVQTGPDLTINNINLTHNGQYYCTAKNKYGTQNTSVLLDVKFPPKDTSVSVSPAGLVVEGDSVTLSCSSDSDSTVNYTWIRERDLKPVQTGPDLTINNINRTERGRYYCRAQNQYGTQNKSVLLDVKYAPKNTSVSAGSVVEGDSVTLSCSSDSNPVANYTWSREGDLNTLETGPNLTINNINPTHHGQYYCTAQNQYGTQNTSVLLDVQYGPKNTSASVSTTGLVVEGDSVTLSCSSDSNPVGNYTWIREGDLKPVQTGPNLTINNINSTHSGRYYCRAENQHGTQNTSVLLDVQYGPKNTSLSVSPASLVVEGDSVTLSCSSDSNPVVNYTWSREGDLKTPQTGPNLTINNTDSTDRGRYYCRALNQHGTQNTSVLLDVKYAPKNTSVSVGLVVEGGSVTLSCSSDSNPDANYTWSRERALETLEIGPNLTINNINLTHIGQYYCRAQNEYGTHNTSVLLDVQYPPKNTSVSVSPADLVVEGDSVTLSCSSDSNPAANYTWIREGDLKPVQTGPNLTINNIDSTDSGRYYCKAQNQHGTQNTSVVLDVKFGPKISSSCNWSDVIQCVCEARGHPQPDLQWHLSGKTLANFTNTSITKEMWGNLSVRSVLSLRRSLLDEAILQCFSKNKYGSAIQQFQPITSFVSSYTPQEPRANGTSLLLLGFALGAFLMMILWIGTTYFKRRKNRKPSESQQSDTMGLMMTQTAILSDSRGNVVYSNKSTLLCPARSPDMLLYSSIDFSSAEPPSGEIHGLDTLTDEYASIRRSEQIDTEQIDTEQFDTEEFDTQKIETEQTDTQTIDTQVIDTQQINTQKTDTEQIYENMRPIQKKTDDAFLFF